MTDALTPEASTPHKDVAKIYCRIKLTDGVTVMGFVYAEKGTRLQDLMNDPRSFIPVQMVKNLPPPHNKVEGTIVLAKRYIVSAEEIKYEYL